MKEALLKHMWIMMDVWRYENVIFNLRSQEMIFD